MKFKKCKKCGDRHLTTCDGGYGHNFKIGEKIYCIKRGKEYFHYCDIYELEENGLTRRDEKNSEVMKKWVLVVLR